METVLLREVRKLASAIEEKDNQIQAIQYKNVALQGQTDLYKEQLQKCQDTTTDLSTRYVPHVRNPGKDKIIVIVQKHTTSGKDKFHNLPY